LGVFTLSWRSKGFVVILFYPSRERRWGEAIYVRSMGHFAVPRMVPRPDTAAFWMGSYDPYLFCLCGVAEVEA
jgi:hypothetical protein